MVIFEVPQEREREKQNLKLSPLFKHRLESVTANYP